jgi:hypothetical protein
VTQPYTPPPSYPPLPSSITGTMDTPTQVAPALSFNTNDSNEYHHKVKEHFEALNRQAQLEIESQMQERNRWKQQQQELSEAHQQQLEEIHNLLHSTRSPIFTPPTLPRSMPFPQPPSVPRPGEGGFQ